MQAGLELQLLRHGRGLEGAGRVVIALQPCSCPLREDGDLAHAPPCQELGHGRVHGVQEALYIGAAEPVRPVFAEVADPAAAEEHVEVQRGLHLVEAERYLPHALAAELVELKVPALISKHDLRL